MLTFFFVALIVLVTVNISIFFNQDRVRDSGFEPDQIPANVSILTRGVDAEMDKDELDKILRFFEEKRQKLDAIREDLKNENSQTVTEEDHEEGEFSADEDSDLPNLFHE